MHYSLECGSLKIVLSRDPILMKAIQIVHNDYVDRFHKLDLNSEYAIEPRQERVRVFVDMAVILFKQTFSCHQFQLFVLESLDDELAVFCIEEEAS